MILAQQLRKKRFNNGAINFSSQEVRFKLDEKGNPIGIMIKESKEAHQLIEEFMLLANRTVAENISKIKVNNKPVPFPYRIHDDPDEEKLLPFVAFAKKFGHKFDTSSPEAIAASFNQLLKDVMEARSSMCWNNWDYAPWPKQNILLKMSVTMDWVLNIIVILLHLSAVILM